MDLANRINFFSYGRHIGKSPRLQHMLHLGAPRRFKHGSCGMDGSKPADLDRCAFHQREQQAQVRTKSMRGCSFTSRSQHLEHLAVVNEFTPLMVGRHASSTATGSPIGQRK